MAERRRHKDSRKPSREQEGSDDESAKKEKRKRKQARKARKANGQGQESESPVSDTASDPTMHAAPAHTPLMEAKKTRALPGISKLTPANPASPVVFTTTAATTTSPSLATAVEESSTVAVVESELGPDHSVQEARNVSSEEATEPVRSC